MTRNQIAYWEFRENERSNRAREAETARSNRANEFETNRANIARETETNRNNVAVLNETSRANKAREVETNRNNLITEAIAQGRLDEDVRHNKVVESETERNNRMNNAIGWRQADASMLSAQGAALRGQAAMLGAAETARSNRVRENQNLYSILSQGALNSANADLAYSRVGVDQQNADTNRGRLKKDIVDSALDEIDANFQRKRSISNDFFNQFTGGLTSGFKIFQGLGGLIK